MLYGGYAENDGYFTGSVERSAEKATVLAAINASQTANAQLKEFANKYLGVTVIAKQNLVKKATEATFLETLNSMIN